MPVSDPVRMRAMARRDAPQSVADLAFHEAGHAVVGCVIGQQVTRVSIKARKDSYGRSEYDQPQRDKWRQPSLREVKRYVVPLLAGLKAQEIRRRGGDSRWLRQSREWIEAEWTLGFKVKNEANRVLKHLWAATGRLLKRRWTAVEQVAAELERVGEVEGSFVRDLIVGGVRE